VGAIANEAQVPSRDIGPLDIGEEHTRVYVPLDVATRVIDALRKTTMRGRKFAVDHDRAPRA
jgi:ATP-dependent RNA helicase DeaD